YRKMSYKFITHPVSLLLLVHLAWIFITTLTSEQFTFSVKFLAAKVWYVIPFYFLAGKLLYRDKVYKTWLLTTLASITLTVIYVMVRHSAFGFSFDNINWVLGPFYPNHVIYASILTLFLPYIWESLAFFKKKSAYWWLMVGLIVLFLIAIKYSYTRAAYISVVALIGAYWLVRLNVLKYALIIAVIVSAIGVRWIVQDNHYLDYAPNYERTISNKEFDDLVEATYNLEDISVMERVYRWVAAFRMASDHPYLGFGPGNFYSFYQPYTLRMFKTYVSDNPEKSGVHCYFLMTTVEQGFPGLIFFVLLMMGIIVTGERAYHLSKEPAIKRRIMANLLSFLAICSLLIVNDVVETDKIGSFFFLSAAMIVRLYIHAHDKKEEQFLAKANPTKP
ncbi:MAG TPA: O-antigen ligase family protein, partial [Saprospiraceae bacterium]|nr:O-antigen ligase family protein [Saprospiraceae bacterium]